MKMTKWMMAAAFALLSVVAFAQTGEQNNAQRPQQEQQSKRNKARGGMRSENMQDYEAALKLNAQQLSQWQALNDAKKQEMIALKNNTTLSQEHKKAQMKTIRQEKQAELKKILSEEQYAQYQTIRKEKMKERKQNRGMRKGANGARK